MANIKKRNLPSFNVQDPGAIDVLVYSDQAGANKVSEVGRCLLPLGNGAGGFTTDATTARILPSAGRNLAIFNNSAVIYSVTVSNSSATAALAVGATDASGNVGVACMPNAYTYVACNQNNWVKTNNALLIVYLIDDSTSIQAVAPAFDSGNP